jgi:hypothetical protein
MICQKPRRRIVIADEEKEMLTPWWKVMEEAKTEARGYKAERRGLRPWHEVMKEAKAEAQAENAEPWRVRLERLRGKICDDGIERISTQAVFDILEIPQRSRGAGACRRLSAVMRDLGWTPVRVRDLTCGGYKEQVRGYCRDPGHNPVRRHTT